MRTLYLAWRHPSRRWYPVGELAWNGEAYRFRYVQGSADAERLAQFRPLVAFPDFEHTYWSRSLFPTFENRIPSPSHPDRADFVEWLALRSEEVTRADPMDLLERGGGQRATDLFEVLPRPTPTPDGSYSIHAFVHGLRHADEQGRKRALALAPGEVLRLEAEPTNEQDPDAVRKLTSDGVAIGYAPRYLARDLHDLGLDQLRVTVVRVNRPPTPIQFRVLCRFDAPWPEGFDPCSGPEFQPRSPATTSTATLP